MKRIILAAIIIAIVILAGILTGIIPNPLELMGEEDYNTGITRDTLNNLETISKTVGCHDFLGLRGCWKGNAVEDYNELIQSPMNNEVIVTAMKSGGRSVEISAFGTIAYVGSSYVHWSAEWGWYVVEITTNGRDWDTIINTKNGQIDEDIVSLFSGNRDKQQYASRGLGWTIPIFGWVHEYKNIYPITFRIKDTYTGALRFTQMTEFAAFYGLQWETHATSVDYAYLASGVGDVEIVETKTRYIAGEDTIKLRVDTGFSGQTQGGEYESKGWQLKIYDNYGNVRKTWIIDDDKRNSRYDAYNNPLDYPIPWDAVASGESHRWSAVLTNTLFDQDEEIFFTITKEELAQAPDIRPILFGQDEYRLGDSMVVYLEGVPNPEGKNDIDGFLVTIIYGRDGIDYIENFHNVYVSALDMKATISVRLTKGDTYATVDAWAFDAPEYLGGIMSEKATAQVWIKDKESAPVEFDFWGILVAALIIIAFGILALFFPAGFLIKLIIFIIGLVIAVLIYVFYFTQLIPPI